MSISVSNSRAALVIAHPGHELCVYNWLETARPLVFVLTDGSGRSGNSRLVSTTNILSHTNAQHGSVYGRFTDSEIYQAILDSDFCFFEEIVTDLAKALVDAEIDYVVGDATEGYNPVHDACRLVIDAAVDISGHISRRPIVNRDFLLFAPHNAQSEPHRDGALLRTLDDVALTRKLEVARAYPELQGEVEAMLDQKMLDRLRTFPELSEHFNTVVLRNMGNEAYRVECLRLADSQACSNGATNEAPFYEWYGELLVASGVYERAIRYRDHILPLRQAMRSLVDAKTGKPQGTTS